MADHVPASLSSDQALLEIRDIVTAESCSAHETGSVAVCHWQLPIIAWRCLLVQTNVECGNFLEHDYYDVRGKMR